MSKGENTTKSGKLQLIPRPVLFQESEKFFQISVESLIETISACENEGIFLKQQLEEKFRLQISIKKIPDQLTSHSPNSISLSLSNFDHLNLAKEILPEAYVLVIHPEGVKIEGQTPAGVFYGIQTLLQIIFSTLNTLDPTILSNKKKIEEIMIPCGSITDYPRFSWRGFMLDVSRHFVKPQIIKEFLDIMAIFKMNVFHWHLVDDQGWRIEIKKYPQLTKIGSKRKGSQIGGFLSRKENAIPVEGYYTQQEIMEIIQYATKLHISVIPEIEMPGHSMAALAAYPELSCSGEQFHVPTRFGIKKDVYCAGKELTFKFLEDVLDEVMELFPSEIIHIGGDEVPKDRWNKCPKCQERIQIEGLKDTDELQVYFINRIGEYIASKGKKMMGWNEILHEKLNQNAIAQHWLRDKKKVIQHLQNNRKFVMSKMGFVYLDYNYIFTSLQKTYEYEPIPEELEPKFHQNVLGIEAPMWTEWGRNTNRLYWMIFPRLFAVAEIGWIPKEAKNYANFKRALNPYIQYFQHKGKNIASLSNVDPKGIKRLVGIFSLFHEPKVPNE